MTPQPRHDLVIVANRLPVTHNTSDSPWETSPGGLVRALLGVLRSGHGVWVGWSGTPDEELEPFSHESIDLVPVAISEDEVRLFYDGFANETLWPLYHDALREPVFDETWWHAYVDVNRRFAEAAAATAAPGAAVWVQDYHLQLVPGMLRELRSDVRIGFFLHVPFPPQELFLRLPWREEILRGLLAADVVGLQRRMGAENLAAVARRVLGAEGEPPFVSVKGHDVLIDAFPISIDVKELQDLASGPRTQDRAWTLRNRLGDPDTVFLSVDRLDYTKGIDVRLEAFRDLLASGELDRDRVVLVVLASPTRDRVGAYVEERRRVEELVGRINGEFSRLGTPVVHYVHQSLPLEDLVALYRAADVILVTPLRDGMNLVAKEFVATRLDDTGVLVLSEFAGAADELHQALLVNPFDRQAVQRAMVEAATMDPSEVRQRMAALRDQISRHDVSRWAETFLAALEPLRVG